MRFHSRIGLVTNSSGEVFVVKRNQVPENVDEIINSLWTIWYNQHADQWEKECFDADFKPAFLFTLEPMEQEDDIHYGRTYTKVDAIYKFFDHLHREYENADRCRMPGQVDFGVIESFIDENDDLADIFDYYCYLRNKADIEQEETGKYCAWFHGAKLYVAELAVEAGLFEEIEKISTMLSQSEGLFGQWRWVKRNFGMYHAYDGAELQGEIDDHQYPQGFVHFVCDTLGWFVYHNG